MDVQKGTYFFFENGTYYGMAMSVRFSVCPSVGHTGDNDSFNSFSQRWLDEVE
jgi:hypothetical protein